MTTPGSPELSRISEIVNTTAPWSEIEPGDLVVCRHKLLRVKSKDRTPGMYQVAFEGVDRIEEVYDGETVTRVRFTSHRSPGHDRARPAGTR